AVEAGEIPDRLELALVLGRHAMREIQGVRDLEAEQIDIEMQRLLHVIGEVAEMAEPADAERPVQHHTADIEFPGCGGIHDPPQSEPLRCASLARGGRAGETMSAAPSMLVRAPDDLGRLALPCDAVYFVLQSEEADERARSRLGPDQRDPGSDVAQHGVP